MSILTEEGSNLRALLSNKSAILNMEPKDIAKIVDAIKKDYDDRFEDIIESLPKEMLGKILLELSQKARHEVLSHIDLDFLYSSFEFLEEDEIALLMDELEKIDEGRFRKLFEKLKWEESTIQLKSLSQTKHVSLDDVSVKLYYFVDDKIKCVGFDSYSQKIDTKNLVWVDLFKANADEIDAVQKALGIEIPTINEREEIEVSSRYWEEDGVTTINSYFITIEEQEIVSETVSLILKDNYLVSVRFRKLKSFDELNKKIVIMPHSCNSGTAVLMTLLDIRIDLDADMLEKLVREISYFRKDVIADRIPSEELLERISRLEDLNMKMRESLQDKNRIMNSLIKNKLFTSEQIADLRIMIKDVASLIVHADFNFERLDSIQNIALASLGIKQGKNISVFTIANVLFLPPTLIASIYGMNFEFMPELQWEFGYPFSILLMIFSAIAPYWWFKKKGLL